jgi:hypothetical protein
MKIACQHAPYSKFAIRNSVDLDDKLLIGCWHKFKQNKNKYDLKSIIHTNFGKRNGTSSATGKGLYNQTQFSTREGWEIEYSFTLNTINVENPQIFSKHCIVNFISALIHNDNFHCNMSPT